MIFPRGLLFPMHACARKACTWGGCSLRLLHQGVKRRDVLLDTLAMSRGIFCQLSVRSTFQDYTVISKNFRKTRKHRSRSEFATRKFRIEIHFQAIRIFLITPESGFKPNRSYSSQSEASSQSFLNLFNLCVNSKFNTNKSKNDRNFRHGFSWWSFSSINIHVNIS